MAPAAERLATVLEKITAAPFSIPIVTNVEGTPNSDTDRVKKLLVEQLSSPVLWDASVIKMVDLGVTLFVEIGPGKVLSGLVKRIDKTVVTKNIEDLAGIKAFVQEVL